MDQLILLKAQFEMSFEDLEKKNKELGTEIFIYFTLLFFYNHFFISFNFNFVFLIFFLNYSCVFDNPWLDFISFFFCDNIIIFPLHFSVFLFCWCVAHFFRKKFAIKKMITFTYSFLLITSLLISFIYEDIWESEMVKDETADCETYL